MTLVCGKLLLDHPFCNNNNCVTKNYPSSFYVLVNGVSYLKASVKVRWKYSIFYLNWI